MITFRQIIWESEDLFGRNVQRKRIHDRLEGKKKSDYEKTVKAERDYYDKVKTAMKSIKLSNYNLSTVEAWQKYTFDLFNALNKAMPGIFKKSNMAALNKDKVSLAGWGSFSLNTQMDKWDYLTAVAMKYSKHVDPDNHKEWFKK
jgi:hypothetical protein